MRLHPVVRSAGLALCICLSSWSASALEIVFRDTTPGGMNPKALGAFQAASSVWASLLSDPVTVFIDIDFRDDGNNQILGGARSSSVIVPYTAVRSALLTDISGPDDLLAAGSLPAGPTFSFWANNLDGTSRFDDDRNACSLTGPSAACGNNNAFLDVSTANAKAMGFNVGTSSAAPDAKIAFNAFYGGMFDFDRDDGIDVGKYDFVAVAAHEMAHALGFLSGVDTVDVCAIPGVCGLDNAFGLEAYAVYKPLDLFRYSAPGQRDLRVNSPAVFSIDGGRTAIESFSTGAYFGDGWQASHFLAGSQNLMNPYGYLGRQTDPSSRDMVALDAIGWDRVAAPIPEPETYALMALGLTLVAWATRRRRAEAFAG
jgi:PEP-CTERM motif